MTVSLSQAVLLGFLLGAQPSPPGAAPGVRVVVSVDAGAGTVVAREGEKDATIALAPPCRFALEFLQPGQEVRFTLQDGGNATGFVVVGPLPKPAANDGLSVPDVPPLPPTSRTGRVVAVDQPGHRLAVLFSDGDHQVVTLQAMAGRTIRMVDPGEDVLLYLKDRETAVAFVITGWPART